LASQYAEDNLLDKRHISLDTYPGAALVENAGYGESTTGAQTEDGPIDREVLEELARKHPSRLRRSALQQQQQVGICLGSERFRPAYASAYPHQWSEIERGNEAFQPRFGWSVEVDAEGVAV